MKLILKDDIDGLGSAGDIVDVSRGYARNYLLPQRRAVPADEANVDALKHAQRTIEKKIVRERAQAEERAREIGRLALRIARQMGEEKLFGSVTAKDIQSVLQEQGVEIDRRRILLKEPIKALGEYQVDLRLHRDVVANVKVEVVEA